MPTKKRRTGKKKKNAENTYQKLELTVESSPFPRDPASLKKTLRAKSHDHNKAGVSRSQSPFNRFHDKGGVARIYSPFNRFGSSRKTGVTMAYQSAYKPSGLSPKEKGYLICSCQSRANRYGVLKTLATNALQNNKIFTIQGNCTAVRKALLDRGWVEKLPPNKMTLQKIRSGKFKNKSEIHGELERLLLSNMVEKASPNFVWRTNDEYYDSAIDMRNDHNTIVNKLKIDALWTTKQGLCSSMKRNYWFNIDNTAEVNCPRTYNTYEDGEIDDFVKDYKITACTSLLKWVLSMINNEKPVFLDTGKISIDVIVFAMNRCKEYLFRKQNKDIDRAIKSTSTGQWNSFLKKYYQVIEKEEVFKTDNTNSLPLYLNYTKILLKEIHKYRPQLSCEGCHNIWIIKPANCSRGRGIRMASKLGVMTNLLNTANNKYVVQKYIEEPLLIHATKFDIRQYYLVTSTYPLIIWCYTECYLKFSSQKYSLKNYHESIHLTNNAVQRKYQNCKGRHSELPQQNMWDLDTYKQYLNNIGKEDVWDNVIYPGMKKSIIGIMLSCQDSLSLSKNRFEMYGCDFILDNEYKPWLIEINSCPDLNHTTQVTAKICPAAVSDIVKVVIDYAQNSKASTGNFECIYRQPMTVARYGTAADLFVKGFALPNDYFYRGTIEIMKTYDNPSIAKGRDLKVVLNKLKRHYKDTIDLEELDDDEERLDETKSKETISDTATVITEKILDLLDRMTSENTVSCQSQIEDVTSMCSIKSISPNPSAESATDIKSLLMISSRVDATTAIKKSFSFSKLDDGPLGKASCLDLINFMKFPNENNFGIPSSPSRDGERFSKSDITEEALRLISFMNKKANEYNE